jgi:hypothetical protein
LRLPEFSYGTHAAVITMSLKALALKLLGALLFLTAIAMWWSRAPDWPVEALVARWAPAPSQFIELDGQLVHFRDEGSRQDNGRPIHLLAAWQRGHRRALPAAAPELLRSRCLHALDRRTSAPRPLATCAPATATSFRPTRNGSSAGCGWRGICHSSCAAPAA